MNDTQLVDYLEHELKLLLVEIDNAKKSPFNEGDVWFDGHKECAQMVLSVIKKHRSV